MGLAPGTQASGPRGTLGTMRETHATLLLADLDPDVWDGLADMHVTTGGIPVPPGMARLGLHADDLSLWPPALAHTPPNDPDDPPPTEVAWGLLANNLHRIVDEGPWLTVHDALAWIIADAPMVCALHDGGAFLSRWAPLTRHGWLPHAAGFTPEQYAAGDVPDEEALRGMVALRGHRLPPFRSPDIAETGFLPAEAAFAS